MDRLNSPYSMFTYAYCRSPAKSKRWLIVANIFFSEILYTLARRILCRSCTPEYKAHTQQRFVQKQPSPKYTAVLSSAADPFEATAAPNNRQLLNITTLMMVMKVLDMIAWFKKI